MSKKHGHAQAMHAHILCVRTSDVTCPPSLYLSGVRESLPLKESSKSLDLKDRIERSAPTASAFSWEWGKDRIPFDLATDVCGGDTRHTLSTPPPATTHSPRSAGVPWMCASADLDSQPRSAPGSCPFSCTQLPSLRCPLTNSASFPYP